ncbi:MAG: hypothetical protein IAA72_04000 [Spirochaetes bacterium]|uniref:Uncharacterized protein n=1 Tax=Candidatus Ornithospirochaeta stercoravium TaxID=2840897 RepID=A0A9D9IAC0_9SPIO|nr:hypothetical protein [Candidatus Ornithospirochaeta stercoravium]
MERQIRSKFYNIVSIPRFSYLPEYIACPEADCGEAGDEWIAVFVKYSILR